MSCLLGMWSSSTGHLVVSTVYGTALIGFEVALRGSEVAFNDDVVTLFVKTNYQFTQF